MLSKMRMPALNKSGSWFYGAVVMLSLLCASTASAQISTTIGLDDLLARLGGAAPDGTGIVISQVEAPLGPGTANYGPDQSHTAFLGKTFTAHSGAPGNSSHATVVGRNFYGSDLNFAPGITDIHLWEVNGWLGNDFLHMQTGSGNPPLPTPSGIKIWNNSWAGNIVGDPAAVNDILRRVDNVVWDDDVLMIVGATNSSPDNGPANLLNHFYNGISVGRADGFHHSEDTTTGDGPGRMKPEMVAPDNRTSWNTAIVSACAALLVDTARTDPLLAADPDAERALVIKAALLAGANHNVGWTNNPATTGPTRGITARPLDDIFGAGTVNINNSHAMLTGGQQNGDIVVPTVANAGLLGWDYILRANAQPNYWRFTVPTTAAEVSIVASWNRWIDSTFTIFTVADVDLTLWRVDGLGQLQTLVGDPGLPFYTSGNVVSESGVDNVEHLYIQNLQPGEYVLAMTRNDIQPTWPIAVAWRFAPPPGPITCPAPGSPDCNLNGVSDECDIFLGTSIDCNNNGIPDECDISGGFSADCNANGVPDECDISLGTSQDCNANGVPDECELAGNDANSNGILDVCEAVPVNNTCTSAITVLAGANPFDTVAATSTGSVESCGNIDSDIWFNYIANCTGTLTVSICDANFDTELAVYSFVCPTGPNVALACNDNACGTGSTITMPVSPGFFRIRIGGKNGDWGVGTLNISCDITPPCPADITPPGGNGVVNIDDLVAILNAFGACVGCVEDITPPGGNGVVNIDDLVALLNAFGVCP